VNAGLPIIPRVYWRSALDGSPRSQATVPGWRSTTQVNAHATATNSTAAASQLERTCPTHATGAANTNGMTNAQNVTARCESAPRHTPLHDRVELSQQPEQPPGHQLDHRHPQDTDDNEGD